MSASQRHIVLFFAFAAVIMPSQGMARNSEGLLDVIETPNNGIPAITIPDGTFDAVLKAEAPLSLVGEGASVPLQPEWTPLSGGRFRTTVRVPAGTSPGMYALVAGGDGAEDTNQRSVCVRESFPEYYVIAHLTDVHMGAQRNVRSSADVFRDLLAFVNASEASFAVITGDLTDSGEMFQFKQFLDILDTCTIPTFVCAGNHDRKELNYERVFGPDCYMFRFGKDGYISYDTKDFTMADESGAQDSDLQIFRRAVKASRWSVGLTHRYEPEMGLRAQIVLFVDDPLDHLIFGHWHRVNTDAERAVPWGTTPMTVTPAAFDGMLRFFDMTESGIKPREPQKAAPTE